MVNCLLLGWTGLCWISQKWRGKKRGVHLRDQTLKDSFESNLLGYVYTPPLVTMLRRKDWETSAKIRQSRTNWLGLLGLWDRLAWIVWSFFSWKPMQRFILRYFFDKVLNHLKLAWFFFGKRYLNNFKVLITSYICLCVPLP